MTAIAAPKSPAQNWLEGFALSAILQGLPTFAAAVLTLKISDAHAIVSDRRGAPQSMSASPRISLQLMTTVIMLSLLAVVAASRA